MEDDLKWVTNELNILLLLKKFHDIVLLQNGKVCHSREMQNDALMHRDGSKD